MVLLQAHLHDLWKDSKRSPSLIDCFNRTPPPVYAIGEAVLKLQCKLIREAWKNICRKYGNKEHAWRSTSGEWEKYPDPGHYCIIANSDCEGY